jgi:AcrR family transcriptional regulator/DNA-binding MarR family transcriptional regulator
VRLSTSQTLRARVLSVAVALVGEVGYARMTVKRVAGLSGVSQDTFHECFEDLDDCLLAAFEDALQRMAGVVLLAYKAEREWPAKIRAAVAALLAAMEDEPALSTFVFVGALGAGPKVLACRLQALERLKIAFENGVDDAGGVAECSPLSAEGTVNGALGILHTRLLAGSPLARRPLGELAGPLTAMIVLPYAGRAMAGGELALARSRSPGELEGEATKRRGGSELRPKPRARKRKRFRLNAKQRALLAALQDGPRTVRELVDLTGMTDQTVRNHVKGPLDHKKVVRTERDGKIAYELPSKGDATAGPPAVAGSSGSNGAGSSNGAGGAASNGAAASNGHDRFAVTRAMLRARDPQISKREFNVLAAIDELNARGSSPSNREIGNETQIYDPTLLSKLIQRLEQLWLVENTGWRAGKQYEWRLTTNGTELLRELEGRVAV